MGWQMERDYEPKFPSSVFPICDMHCFFFVASDNWNSLEIKISTKTILSLFDLNTNPEVRGKMERLLRTIVSQVPPPGPPHKVFPLRETYAVLLFAEWGQTSVGASRSQSQALGVKSNQNDKYVLHPFP